MFLVGLTGGIGSGKSTVAAMLAARGAVIIDADQIAREVVAPDGPAYAAVVSRFGEAILASDGTLDRAALADIVFRDPSARADLEAITHPALGQVMAERMASYAQTDQIVVLDIPLLTDRRRMGVQAVLVVDCEPEQAVERLVAGRGFDPGDARRRIVAQISREQRLALADVVVTNEGPLEALPGEVDRAWAWLCARRDRSRQA